MFTKERLREVEYEIEDLEEAITQAAMCGDLPDTARLHNLRVERETIRAALALGVGSVRASTIELPASWASFLVNGDASGVDNRERLDATNIVAAQKSRGWVIVATDGEPFTVTNADKLLGYGEPVRLMQIYIMHRVA